MTKMLMLFSIGSLTARHGVAGINDNVNAIQLHITEDSPSAINAKCGTCNGCYHLESNVCRDLARYPVANERSCVQNGGSWCAMSTDANESSLGSFADGNGLPAFWQNITIGSSDGTNKCVDVANNVSVACAADAGDKGKRLGEDSWNDTFIITTDLEGKKVCAKRTDEAKNWDLQLKIECNVAPKFKVMTEEGEDWTTVSCDSGQRVLSGGCDARKSPHYFRWSGPVGNNAWKCGGFLGKKTVWAICSEDLFDIKIEESEGTDWHTVDCGAQKKVIGGGCKDMEKGYFKYSAPQGTNQWRCGGNGGNKYVWAMCSSGIKIKPEIKVKKEGPDWTSVPCDEGQYVIGGGCESKGDKFQYSGPDGNNAWKCGGHGAVKTVWAICASPHVGRSRNMLIAAGN